MLRICSGDDAGSRVHQAHTDQSRGPPHWSGGRMSWEQELGELRRRTELAHEMGGAERVARQRASGRLTVRERIERLFDDGTFHETGTLAGRATYGDDGEI